MSPIRAILSRLSRSRVWVLLQFGLTLLLLALGLAWTRLPDKHAWQILLSLLVPALLAIAFFELQAGAMRKLAPDDGKRVKLVWGAITLLVWVAAAWFAWSILDWCDDRIYLIAGYLNSKAPASLRAKLLNYDHIQLGLTILEWIFRWIVVPAKVVPFAAASAQWGLRLPWRRIMRFLFNWRWWAGVAVASLLGVYLPGTFFDKAPTGSVTAQEWHVVLKLGAAYFLAVGSWVVLLAWQAVLFAPKQTPPTEEALVAVPVLTGPPDRNTSAKVDVP